MLLEVASHRLWGESTATLDAEQASEDDMHPDSETFKKEGGFQIRPIPIQNNTCGE
jgi:hypothetical protein